MTDLLDIFSTENNFYMMLKTKNFEFLANSVCFKEFDFLNFKKTIIKAESSFLSLIEGSTFNFNTEEWVSQDLV
jgi:hypothetical protein